MWEESGLNHRRPTITYLSVAWEPESRKLVELIRQIELQAVLGGTFALIPILAGSKAPLGEYRKHISFSITMSGDDVLINVGMERISNTMSATILSFQCVTSRFKVHFRFVPIL
jgi:hypothetical protein